MENSSEGAIVGESYEIIDKYVENEEMSNSIQQSSVGNIDVEKESMSIAPLESNISNENIQGEKKITPNESANRTILNNSSSDNKIENNTIDTKSKYSQQSEVEPIDFTADISLDQSVEQKDVTDEDVLRNLNEIENIVLNSMDFQVQQEQGIENKDSNEENNESVAKPQTNGDINDNKVSHNIRIESEEDTKLEKPEKIDWYEKKLSEKETIIKERLSKVARVLGISYPCYEKWLEREEKINGTPLCKLKPSQRCCLDKPYTNRWKFICNRKKVFEPTVKMENVDSSSNQSAEIIWKLEASGAWDVNINNKSEFPPFVLRAVKIFEDFLQTTEQLNSQKSVNENFSDDVSLDVESKKKTNREGRQDWSWLLVRCNSMDQLMLFATGKNISRSTMDRLKLVYESGAGKDCNVKSLYCKSINKYEDTTVVNTTFLVGSEALDEVVGGLKVQLAPKTNFWSNTAGAENVANTVMNLLAPTRRTTVLEIGCGIGIIGLMMASICQQVIGVDSPSEVEEAEMICELNNIKNASFIMGSPAEVTPRIIAAVKNRKTCAVINANTNIGRAIEVITCLRKILSLKRIVVITTLTKQSVRAILELVRPGDQIHGSPFIPNVACIVDTLPIGPHCETVILMHRRKINKLIKNRPQKSVEEEAEKSESKNVENRIDERSTNVTDNTLSLKEAELQSNKNVNKPLTKQPIKKLKNSVKKAPYTKNKNFIVKSKVKGKRPHSPDKGDAPPKKLMKRFEKFGAKCWHTESSAKNKKWNVENSQVCVNQLYKRRMREAKKQTDLRERLSNNRLDTDIVHTVKEHQALLEVAKQKLSGPAPAVDVNTAKQLQNMLNMVLEQTNKLQSQLPRSVWDRIALPENTHSDQRETKQNDSVSKSHYIQTRDSEHIVMPTQNKTFSTNTESTTSPIYTKYSNLPPLEPNTIVTVTQPINHTKERPFHTTAERYETEISQQQAQENVWNRDRPFERNRWNEMGNITKPNSPMRGEHRVSPRKRLSPKRPLLSPPRRPCSPPRRHFSPFRRPLSPMYRQRSPIRRQISPQRRPMSPPRPLLSPPRRHKMMLNRPVSPLNHPVSLSRRQTSPIRSNISPSRMQPLSLKRPLSPPRGQPSNLSISFNNDNNRRVILLAARRRAMQEQQLSTIGRTVSLQRSVFDRPISPPKRQHSPQRRQISPQRFADNWDIPNRSAAEQTIWNGPVDRMSEQNVWRTEKASISDNNWESATGSAKQCKSFNQDPNRNDTWNNGGNTWNSKHMSTKPMAKETWLSSSDNRWSGVTNMPGCSNSNWNVHGKKGFPAYQKPWLDNKKQGKWESINVKLSWKPGDKEELNELPENARDPWGDDDTPDLKERWHKFDSNTASSTWIREYDQQGSSWTKLNTDKWQNKALSFATKLQWQKNCDQNVEPRSLCQNDIDKKTSSNEWRGGNNVGSWQFHNSNF